MVQKLISAITIFLMFAVARPVFAQNIAGESATFHYTASSSTRYHTSYEYFEKKKAIKAYLDLQNAPLAAYTDSFIEACDTYKLDCYLLPAIAGVESTFGKFILPGSNNPFGWGRGNIPFANFHEAIMTVGQGLRENYINKGAVTVDQIGRIYCEGNTWSGKVQHFMNKLEETEKNQLYFSGSQVQL